MHKALPTEPEGLAATRAQNRKGSSDPVDVKTTGEPLLPTERKALRRAGHILSFADILWIAQAAIVAALVSAFVPAALTDAPSAFDEPGIMIIVAAAGGFFALAFLRLRLTLRSQKMALKAAQSVKSRLRGKLLDAFSATSPAAHLPASGEIAAHMGEQIDAVGPYLSNFFPQKVRLSIVPLAILIAMGCISWLAALILLMTGPIIPVFMALIGLRAKSASLAQQHELTRMSGMVMDRLRGLETLRLFGAVESSRQEIEAVGTQFRKGTMKVLRIAFLSSTVLELFSALGIAFIAVFVGFSLLGDVSTGIWVGELTFGAGLFLLLLAPEFYAPLRAYAAAYHERSSGLAALESLQGLDQRLCGAAEVTPHSGKGRTTGGQTVSFAGSGLSIEMEDVSVRLGGHPVLEQTCDTIVAGEKVLLVGQSGAGKTTLIDLLLGFHRPESGRVLVGGLDLETLDKDWWRGHVAWLGQAPVLAHGSLRSNLLVARPNASEAEVLAALDLAGARALVARLPRGLDTRIGENGFGLSIGEQRRVALARAALRRDALLILADEPTAGLDRETADLVIDGLLSLARDKTLLIATHDEALLARNFRQIKMRSGTTKAPEDISA
ncbi:thiol reductant ABC exporter subunit CydD [Roseibium sp. CAU 1637]|uniref:Thiol reductant ABC exporter subunit CydD n=1 Tax=Roseibium limicola TaxID=2816037 RepID=A0A939EPF9_9HYPH|nr:thiol reductant ABC exporter subunit CydD [Roseibium limicola]MBO0345093.1 thiol reductant ABC exporter subunit CydD [Roseibium limicola]